MCFSGRSEKQNGRPGLWLAETFSTSLKKNRWTEFNETWQEARSQCLLSRSCFSWQSGKTKWPPWPLIGRDIFDFSSETANRNSTKLDRKQDLKALYQVCVFQVDRKNKMAVQAYNLLRHFQLFLWNCWIEFNKTWQEARYQHPLLGLRFSGWSETQDSRPVLWLVETFWTSPMKPLNGIRRNLTESKFSTSFTKMCFSGWSKKQCGRPGLWLAETYFDFSSETAERN